MSSIYTSRERLSKIFYKANEDTINRFYDSFVNYHDNFKIETLVYENFFFAEIIAETGYSLKPIRENLNYSVNALKSIFKKYRENPEWAERDGYIKNGNQYIKHANKENIGNIAYAGRIGNGPIASGDGYRFRGGGYFQLTGRDNYSKMASVISDRTDINVSPEDVANKINTIEMSLLTAMAFWYINKCYECNHIDCVTSKINKYTDSYEKRKKIYQKIASI